MYKINNIKLLFLMFVQCFIILQGYFLAYTDIYVYIYKMSSD